MTDLLGLLSGIHSALVHHGALRLTITDLGDLAGAVDLHTGTIHLAPGLGLADTLHALADALAVLDPPAEDDEVPIAVGDVPSARVPAPRHLTVVSDHPQRVRLGE